MGASPLKRRNAGTASAHYDLIDERCFQVVSQVVRELEASHVEYVLAGGWAVYAYGSHVPSVDTDVLLLAADADRVSALVRQSGIAVGAGRQFEPLALQEPNNLLGPDVDMQETERGYVRRAILNGRTARRELDLAARGSVTAIVPSPAALLFMKLKAYHDRELSWMALRDDAIMARRIPVADRPQVRQLTVGHYYRKAGKDLYDIAYLAVHHEAVEDAHALASEVDLLDDLAPLTTRAYEPLRRFALDMAAEEKDDVTAAWIERLPRA